MIAWNNVQLLLELKPKKQKNKKFLKLCASVFL